MSPHAAHNVHPHQFTVPDDHEQRPEPPRIGVLSKAEFVTRMKEVEKKYGPPKTITYVEVESTDANVLAGKGNRMEVMFAIGMMPETVPVELRKASLRAEIRCKLSEQAKKEVMEQYGYTAEQADSDDSDIAPYYKMKTVLVDEGGALKVGYFECVGPSIWD